MNLFIGLLNIAIDDYNKEEEFLFQKAQVIFFNLVMLVIMSNFIFINIYFKDNFGN